MDQFAKMEEKDFFRCATICAQNPLLLHCQCIALKGETGKEGRKRGGLV